MGPRQYDHRESVRRACAPRRMRINWVRCGKPAIGKRVGGSVGAGSSSLRQMRVWGIADFLRGFDPPRTRRRPWDMAGVRSGWSSRSAVGTGPLRRSLAVHSRPIDLVVSQEPLCLRTGNLVLEGASRLDAFSAYPVPTWLPGDAPSGTAGTPEVGPPQSSRTRGDSPQVSYAHGR